MMLDQSQPKPETKPQKERCPIEGSTQFYWKEQGLEYRCRHCKQAQLVPWTEVLQRYRELVGITT